MENEKIFSCLLAGNPNSVMSPASASQSEDQLYMDKLKQLSKYIEPLRRMINKIDKNEGIVCVFLKVLSSCHCFSSVYILHFSCFFSRKEKGSEQDEKSAKYSYWSQH